VDLEAVHEKGWVPLYRKKPVVIEARVYKRDTPAQQDALAEWCGGRPCLGGMFITTLGGEHLAKEGDYIVKGLVGEVYPVKPHVFRASYEAVDD
jgi:hypothetical protein